MAVNVGTSYRTAMKHKAMHGLVAEEVGALSTMKFQWVKESDWFDLTAGNGIAVDETGCEIDRAPTEFWGQHCSPGILSSQAMKSHKPVVIHMYELDRATYRILVKQMTFQLGRMGFTAGDGGLDDFRWVGTSEHGQPITITAFCGSGHTATTRHIRSNKHAVLVLNDPNNPNQWAVRDGFAVDILSKTNLLRMFHAIGANARGIKRSDRPLRERWFKFVETETAALGDRHDLLLYWLRDSHQWAYMIRTSLTWRTKTESLFDRSFRNWPNSTNKAWYCTDRARFDNAIRRLFLTNDEYENEESDGDTLCLF